MWRWSQGMRAEDIADKVFSTYVEMILCFSVSWEKGTCILHVCGDDPCTLNHVKASLTVFSTYVEMILIQRQKSHLIECILHVCGDDPLPKTLPQVEIEYSPRMWRWSFGWLTPCNHINVFSTYVEMILILELVLAPYLSILHVCGDDPIIGIFC